MNKPSEVRRKIDASQNLLNKRYAQARTILITLEANGVTDSDFDSIDTRISSGSSIAYSLETAEQGAIDEAIDLCEILSSEKKGLWPFRRKPKDTTTKSLIRRLMILYYAILG